MAETMTKSLRIPRETLQQIEREFQGRDFSSVANELLAEGLKIRRCPGIEFVTTGNGKRTARITGTRIYVWLIIAGYNSLDEDWGRLKTAFHWLKEEQLKAALNYYQCYPEEIDARMQADQVITAEALYERYPFMRPPNADVLPRRGSQSNNRKNPPKKRSRRR